MVLYKSSRGISPSVSFQQALLSGYAPDGGLYLPETLPSLGKEQLKAWAKLSYMELLQTMLPLFVSPTEITVEEIKGECISFASAEQTTVL